MGKKNPLKMKSMPQTAFILQPTLLPHRDNLLPLKSKTLPFLFLCLLFLSSLFFHRRLLSLWIWFLVWFALGSCPLKRGPWVSRGLPVCFPVSSGEAGPTQLLWQPVFPRRDAKVVEPLRGELGQRLLMEKPFHGVSSEPPTRAKTDSGLTHQPQEPQEAIPSGSINSFL